MSGLHPDRALPFRIIRLLRWPPRMAPILLLTLCVSADAQNTPLQPPRDNSSLPAAPSAQDSGKAAVMLRNTPVHFLDDQKAIWTRPLRLRMHDLEWLLPFAAATGAAVATDYHTMGSVVSHDPGFNQSNVNASNALIGGFIAAPVALYGFGRRKDDAHAQESGILGGEALLDGVVVEQGLKLIFWRERPAKDNARGLFFQGSTGVNSSFPSSHTVLSWSIAAVLAEEYPSKWNQLGIYSLATGASPDESAGTGSFSDECAGGALCFSCSS